MPDLVRVTDELDPWFVRRPALSLLVAGLLYVGVTALRFGRGHDLAAGISMLYVLPVSLVALTRGRAAGILAGLVATSLFLLWTQLEDVDLDALGYAARALPLLLVGYLLGDAADRLRRANAHRVEHEMTALRHRQAVEVNDLLVQGMAASKWSFEAGRIEAGLQTLDETIATGQHLVSRLISDAGGGRQVMS